MSRVIIIILINLTLIVSSRAQVENEKKKRQDQIIEEVLKSDEFNIGLYSIQRQEAIDKGLAKDSTVAYLWQQKAMPLYKQGKYELGLPYLDKAVKYDKEAYLEYRAFMKCIFAKTYKDAIIDFEECKKMRGNSYVMDHSYDFYIALCYLQLNEFEKSERILENNIDSLITAKNEDWVHHLDLFYFGISKYEQKKYKEAIEVFNWALKKYPQFSDVQYYKANALAYLRENDEAQKMYEEYKINAAVGYTINEDNVVYELYPYQKRWLR